MNFELLTPAWPSLGALLSSCLWVLKWNMTSLSFLRFEKCWSSFDHLVYSYVWLDMRPLNLRTTGRETSSISKFSLAMASAVTIENSQPAWSLLKGTLGAFLHWYLPLAGVFRRASFHGLGGGSKIVLRWECVSRSIKGAVRTTIPDIHAVLDVAEHIVYFQVIHVENGMAGIFVQEILRAVIGNPYQVGLYL